MAKKTDGKSLVWRLWERHGEECDKALEALNQGDQIKFEFYRGSAAAILYTISDIMRAREEE